jgi:hypothetical protein
MRVVRDEGVAGGRVGGGHCPVVGRHHPRSSPSPFHRVGHDALAEVHLVKDGSVETADAPGEQGLEPGVVDASLHHLDEEPLDLGL